MIAKSVPENRKRKYSLFLVRFSCIKEKDGVE